MRVPTAKAKKLQNIDNIFEQPREKSNRNGIGDTRINDGDWVSHDATALRVAKAVNKSPHRPFHHRRHYERQKPECGGFGGCDAGDGSMRVFRRGKEAKGLVGDDGDSPSSFILLLCCPCGPSLIWVSDLGIECVVFQSQSEFCKVSIKHFGIVVPGKPSSLQLSNPLFPLCAVE
ncbi:hypothetical protein HYC85_002241 [Camellia sinensis]|uniref:Uncharacterized protein n=1 Tax=Camellia sinensis TaxID=4442 RepID=A0A7J7I7N7_CAMSI|nr:hypothetical protein HYC85_002241 [Camellia sinensis]